MMTTIKLLTEASTRRFERFSPWATVLGVALIALGQWLWLEYPLNVQPGMVVVLAGITMVIVSLRPRVVLLHDGGALDRTAGRKYAWSWKLPFAVVGVWLCLYTGWHAVKQNNTVWELYLMWGAGIWFTVYGLVPHDAAMAWWDGLRRSLQHDGRTWLLVALIFVIALVLRTAWLNTSPYIMAGDEAAFAIQAVDIKDKLHWQVNPFKYGVWHHPWVYHTMMGLTIDVFGQNAAGARMPSAILGALTAPAVYFMGRRMFDRRVGLIAAIFMATFPLHVHFSRTAINQAGDPLFAALTFGFLTRALREGDTMEAAWAGLAMGLSQYFYSASRIIPLLMGGYVGLYVLVDWRTIWKRWSVLAVTGIVASVVVFPNLYAVYEDKERSISPRLDQVSIWKTGNVEAAAERGELREYWTNQIQRSFLAYVQIPDESGFYGAYNPILGWYAGVPFLVGLALAVVRWRDPRFLILGVWVASTAVLGGVLMVDPPHYPRYISVTPGLAVLVALGIVWGGTTLAMLLIRLKRVPVRVMGCLGWLIPLAMVLALALGDQWTYIRGYLPKKLVYGEPTVQLNEVIDILETFDGEYSFWYFSTLDLDLNGTDLLRYLLAENGGQEYTAEINRWYEVLTPGKHAFVIAPGRFEETIGLLMFEFPEGELREYINRRTDRPLVYLYLVNISWQDWQTEGG